jgi:hypothetical protein
LYEQRIDAAPDAGGTYQLRTDHIVILNAGQGVVYEMSLRLPADATPGPATLTWKLLEPPMTALTPPVSALTATTTVE